WNSMSAPSPVASVVIPVFNDRQRLERCLDALEQQTYPAERFEVIVVDNGSTQTLDDLATRYRIQLGRESRPGAYAARNRGLAMAVGEVIAFTDSDCLPDRDWMERGVAALERAPECGFVAGPIDVFARDPKRPSMA